MMQGLQARPTLSVEPADKPGLNDDMRVVQLFGLSGHAQPARVAVSGSHHYGMAANFPAGSLARAGLMFMQAWIIAGTEGFLVLHFFKKAAPEVSVR